MVKTKQETYQSGAIVYPIEAKTTALLIIDMQNDFIHDDGYSARHAKAVGGRDSEFIKAAVPHVAKLSQAMRGIGVPVIHCVLVWEADYADCGVPRRFYDKEARESGYLRKGSWGAQIIDELIPQKGDYVVEAKCYSKFPYTPLELILRNKGIKTLVCTGINASVCVEATIRDAGPKGFQCIMTSDGTISRDRQLQEDTLKRLGNSVTAVLTCDEVEELLRDN